MHSPYNPEIITYNPEIINRFSGMRIFFGMRICLCLTLLPLAFIGCSTVQEKSTEESAPTSEESAPTSEQSVSVQSDTRNFGSRNNQVAGSYTCETLAFQPAGELLLEVNGSYTFDKSTGSYVFDGQKVVWQSGDLAREFGDSVFVDSAEGRKSIILQSRREDKTKDAICKF